MAVAIFWRQKEILNCQNYILRGLYNSISDIIDRKKINFNKELEKLIERFEIAGDGWGFNLADYITSEENFSIFLNLIRDAIDLLYAKNSDLLEDYKKIYESFYQELINIQKSL